MLRNQPVESAISLLDLAEYMIRKAARSGTISESEKLTIVDKLSEIVDNVDPGEEKHVAH